MISQYRWRWCCQCLYNEPLHSRSARYTHTRATVSLCWFSNTTVFYFSLLCRQTGARTERIDTCSFLSFFPLLSWFFLFFHALASWVRYSTRNTHTHTHISNSCSLDGKQNPRFFWRIRDFSLVIFFSLETRNERIDDDDGSSHGFHRVRSEEYSRWFPHLRAWWTPVDRQERKLSHDLDWSPWIRTKRL